MRFNASTVRRCEFARAGMQGVSLFAAVFDECKMMGLDFSRGPFDAATFTRVNLDYASLRGIDLSGVASSPGVDARVRLHRREPDRNEPDRVRPHGRGLVVDYDERHGCAWVEHAGPGLRRGPYGVILTTKAGRVDWSRVWRACGRSCRVKRGLPRGRWHRWNATPLRRYPAISLG